MADTGIFATTAEIVRKAGYNASSVASAEAYTNDFIAQAESEINAATRFNWTDVYSTLNDDVKGILKEAASNLAAMYVIQYDMGSIGRREAADRINVLRDSYIRCIAILRDVKSQTFVRGA